MGNGPLSGAREREGEAVGMDSGRWGSRAANSTMRATWSASVTSVRMVSAPSAATSAIFSSLISATTTFAPSRRKASHQARPSPSAPPVITTVLPSSVAI